MCLISSIGLNPSSWTIVVTPAPGPSLYSAFMRDLQETSQLLVAYNNITLTAYEVCGIQIKHYRERQFWKEDDLFFRYLLVPEPFRRRPLPLELLLMSK